MALKAASMVNCAFVGLGLCALLWGPPAAVAGETRVWTLAGLEEKKPGRIFLGYAVPESDDSFGGFSCKPRSGTATFFVAETSEKLKPGKSATAVISAGGVSARITGKLTPNEEAGVPGFEGRIGAGDPIFAALAGADALTVVIGASRQTAPLKGAAEKFRKFAAACARP